MVEFKGDTSELNNLGRNRVLTFEKVWVLVSILYAELSSVSPKPAPLSL